MCFGGFVACSCRSVPAFDTGRHFVVAVFRRLLCCIYIESCGLALLCRERHAEKYVVVPSFEPPVSIRSGRLGAPRAFEKGKPMHITAPYLGVSTYFVFIRAGYLLHVWSKEMMMIDQRANPLVRGGEEDPCRAVGTRKHLYLASMWCEMFE